MKRKNNQPKAFPYVLGGFVLAGVGLVYLIGKPPKSNLEEVPTIGTTTSVYVAPPPSSAKSLMLAQFADACQAIMQETTPGRVIVNNAYTLEKLIDVEYAYSSYDEKIFRKAFKEGICEPFRQLARESGEETGTAVAVKSQVEPIREVPWRRLLDHIREQAMHIDTEENRVVIVASPFVRHGSLENPKFRITDSELPSDFFIVNQESLSLESPFGMMDRSSHFENISISYVFTGETPEKGSMVEEYTRRFYAYVFQAGRAKTIYFPPAPENGSLGDLFDESYRWYSHSRGDLCSTAIRFLSYPIEADCCINDLERMPVEEGARSMAVTLTHLVDGPGFRLNLWLIPLKDGKETSREWIDGNGNSFFKYKMSATDRDSGSTDRVVSLTQAAFCSMVDFDDLLIAVCFASGESNHRPVGNVIVDLDGERYLWEVEFERNRRSTHYHLPGNVSLNNPKLEGWKFVRLSQLQNR